MERNNNSLFFTCSLIEYIARKTNNHPNDIVKYLDSDVERIYNYEDVFHCEPIEKVANDFIIRDNIRNGDTDYISRCKYLVPDYWDVGEIFERLIEDCYEKEDVFIGIREVYSSWITDEILNFNTDLYNQSRNT